MVRDSPFKLLFIFKSHHALGYYIEKFRILGVSFKRRNTIYSLVSMRIQSPLDFGLGKI